MKHAAQFIAILAGVSLLGTTAAFRRRTRRPSIPALPGRPPTPWAASCPCPRRSDRRRRAVSWAFCIPPGTIIIMASLAAGKAPRISPNCWPAIQTCCGNPSRRCGKAIGPVIGVSLCMATIPAPTRGYVRHAQLLADAGIDTLIFDVTNAQTYPDVYHKMGEVFQQMRSKASGRRRSPLCSTPRPANRPAALQGYRPGLYRDLWFRWQGKPLMLCDPAEASPELRQFFTLRRARWPNWRRNTPLAWHWEAVYPQPYGYTDDPEKARASERVGRAEPAAELQSRRG